MEVHTIYFHEIFFGFKRKEKYHMPEFFSIFRQREIKTVAADGKQRDNLEVFFFLVLIIIKRE